jgi:hypothetical protein
LCPSVYIQEGQAVNNGYLLLGVYARRAPSCTVREKARKSNALRNTDTV